MYLGTNVYLVIVIVKVVLAIPAAYGDSRLNPGHAFICSYPSGNATYSAVDDVYNGKYRIEKCRHRTAGLVDVLDAASRCFHRVCSPLL